MSYTVQISQYDAPITVELGQTILEAALTQGVPYPHGCRSGNCGACKSKLIAGEVEMLPHSEYALSADERINNLVLACRSVPWEDVQVAWLNEEDIVTHPLRNMVCQVKTLSELTHDIKQVRLEIISGGPFNFSAGQYASLTIDSLPSRDYSMANLPEDPVIEFHIRHIVDGITSTYVQHHLAEGDRVLVEGPHGSSWLRESQHTPIIALAGGSGLAPIKSIVGEALEKGMQQDIYLYFGIRDERDIYLESTFLNLAKRYSNLRFIPVLSEPSADTSRRTGYLHEAVITDFEKLDNGKAYLAGPPPMIEAATNMLLELGLGRENIHADAFYTEAEKMKLENQDD